MARGRGAASPQDKEASLLISKKLKELLKETGKFLLVHSLAISKEHLCLSQPI